MSIIIKQVNKDNIEVALASGKEKAYLAIPSYNEGDKLVFVTEESKYISVKIAENVKEAILYLPTGEFTFPVPEGEALRGFAAGTFEGEQEVYARAATEEEVEGYRNLCLNPLDIKVAEEAVDPDAPEWSNPTDSAGVEQNTVMAYPHVYANRVTRNEGCFFARNAIDGVAEPGGHGDYPYHTWGGGVHEDLCFGVYFGREVAVDKLVLYLRSDFTRYSEGLEHDTYWNNVEVELSDGFKTAVKPVKTGDGQAFDLGEHKIEWLKLVRLDPFKSDDSMNFAALNQIEVWGRG